MNPPRQLVLLCDGTNNNLSGRHSDTHVVLLAELLGLYPDPDRLVYCDPGVGNPGQLPGTTVADKFRRARERIDGLAFGRGLFDNVAEGYRFLMANWRPGDQIFVFGFSRGAFTARSIAGLVNAFGIIDGHQDTLVSSLVATYFSRQSPERKAIADQAARLFGQGSTPAQWPEIHFVGVWDTVASVGLPPFGLKITAKPDLAGKHFRHVRQALALDEQRAQFLPRAYAENDGAYTMVGQQPGDIRQCWFRGSHCDVGGGNPYRYSELSRAPFAWLVAEALACGLNLPANARHPALATEADVTRLMPALDPVPPTRDAARINSETRAMPLWALTGLKVRDTARAAMDEQASLPVKMSTHPSVSQWTQAFPAGTVWRAPGTLSWVTMLAWLLVLPLLALMGWSLVPPQGPLAPQELLHAAWDANLRFQQWQLGLPLAEWSAVAKGFERPGTALLLDLMLIAAYTWLLAPWVCRAFARHAGLIRVGERPPAWLNRAGWALPMAVGADLLEDLLSWLALLAVRADSWIASPLGLLLAAASLVKWVGLLGVAALILTSFKRRQAVPAPQVAAT
ncbi:DUF2235 domain-containing protein [Roseateles sp.]|uniref:T6SS phospholipase effector Tle1-like catalytic domain-containing protein n=1 Tax=Roseateles sp. TaxID=1971397 RepID=UPI0025EC3EB2|nr:DUF2235 domain-containing protein [Roseateles sp.]MBV8035667.1 DUF2235 domain-containing protein [Roseateles sp.]